MSDLVTADQATIARLTDEVTALRGQLADQRLVQQGVVNLRRQLAPLYKALQQIFGELDGLVSADMPQTDNPERAYYQTWKHKLGVGASKIIDALLDHGPMTIQALSVATGYNRNSIPQYLAELRKCSLVVTIGGKQKLKRS